MRREGVDTAGRAPHPVAMSITLSHVLITLMLGAIIAVLLGGGFAWGCRLPELDDSRNDG